ncbi:hypothetical protein B0H12DRAFT_288390 [Mycena haematopus]|nr:hypothetical protein B0H12DRAFT_288390 [Mycena haematopus]
MCLNSYVDSYKSDTTFLTHTQPVPYAVDWYRTKDNDQPNNKDSTYPNKFRRWSTSETHPPQVLEIDEATSELGRPLQIYEFLAERKHPDLSSKVCSWYESVFGRWITIKKVTAAASPLAPLTTFLCIIRQSQYNCSDGLNCGSSVRLGMWIKVWRMGMTRKQDQSPISVA